MPLSTPWITILVVQRPFGTYKYYICIYGIWFEIAEALRIVTILKGTSQDKQILGSKSCQQGYDTGIAANA